MYKQSGYGEKIGRKAFQNLVILWLGIVLFTFAAAVCVSSASASADDTSQNSIAAPAAQ